MSDEGTHGVASAAAISASDLLPQLRGLIARVLPAAVTANAGNDGGRLAMRAPARLLKALPNQGSGKDAHQVTNGIQAYLGVPAHRPLVVDEVLLVLPGGLNQVFEISPKPCVGVACRDGIGKEFQPRNDIAALGPGG